MIAGFWPVLQQGDLVLCPGSTILVMQGIPILVLSSRHIERLDTYHLREQALAAERPQNPKELFNLRHASLRNIVERTFGVLKGRFVILQKAPRQYSIRTQIQLVYALTGLHDSMNTHGHDPESEIAIVDDEDHEEQQDNGGPGKEIDLGMSARNCRLDVERLCFLLELILMVIVIISFYLHLLIMGQEYSRDHRPLLS